jgi:hypothetical protein
LRLSRKVAAFKGWLEEEAEKTPQFGAGPR